MMDCRGHPRCTMAGSAVLRILRLGQRRRPDCGRGGPEQRRHGRGSQLALGGRSFVGIFWGDLSCRARQPGHSEVRLMVETSKSQSWGSWPGSGESQNGRLEGRSDYPTFLCRSREPTAALAPERITRVNTASPHPSRRTRIHRGKTAHDASLSLNPALSLSRCSFTVILVSLNENSSWLSPTGRLARRQPRLSESFSFRGHQDVRPIFLILK